MRTLNFIVDGQIINKDPDCDFGNLVPGTEGYVRAHFSFSPEWNGCVKVASFWSAMGKEYPPQVLADGVSCMIPSEALERYSYGIQIIGKKENYKISTNMIEVRQDGGNK